MARLSFPIAIFFCLLAGSRANLPENDDATEADLSERRMTATILLPSEKPGYEAATLVQLDHDHDISSSGSARGSNDTNRDYIRRHHPAGHSHCCRHGHRHHWVPRLRDHEGSHKVILARRFPGRWVRIHHGKPRSGHVDLITLETHARKPHLHHHAKQAEHGGNAEYHLRRHRGMAGKEKDDVGLFMNIRKFLGRF